MALITAMDMINKLIVVLGIKNMENIIKTIIMFSVGSLMFDFTAEAQQQNQANTWTFIPSIYIQETYTDDVDLDSRFRQSDFVTLTRVGALVNRQGPKLDLNVNYELSHLFYPSLDDDNDEFRHNLNANSQSEIIDDHLFFDTNASVTQNYVDRRATFATSIIPRTNNRATFSIIDLSPYYVNKVGDNFAILTTQYHFNYLSAGNDVSILGEEIGVFDSTSHEFSSTLNSGSRFNKITWEFRNSYQALKYSNIQDDNIYLSNLTVDYNYNRNITLIGSFGYTRRNDPLVAAIAEAFSGVIWRVGGRLTPGPRTVLEVTYGKEFFGNTFDASGSYQITSTLNFAFQYVDRVGSSQLFLISDFQNDFTTNNIEQAFLDIENSRQKRALIILSGTRGRNTISISGEYANNINPEDIRNVFASRNLERKTFSLSYQRTVSERLLLDFTTSIVLEDSPDFSENDFYVGLTGGIEYALRDDIALSFEYIYSRRRQQFFNIIERDSNYVSASIGMTF